MMSMMMKEMIMITLGTAVLMTMCTVMSLKEGNSSLQAVYLEEVIAGKYFNFRTVSMYKLIYRN